MKPRKQRDGGEQDLFRARLDNIINPRHELVRLAGAIAWQRFEAVAEPLFTDIGNPALPSRLMFALMILKHMYGLSDEELVARWVENPYFQYFCGETFFQHQAPFDRSSLTRWRQRLGEEHLSELIKESLATALRIGALAPGDVRRITVDTTVQPKNIAFPTDARLLYTSMTRLVRLAKRHGVKLRQSYVRVGKLALIKSQRYAHAKQFKRHRREVRFLNTRLGRLIRDIGRKIDGDSTLEEAFGDELDMAVRLRQQRQRQRGPKFYSLHAPETECIGKGKAAKPSLAMFRNSDIGVSSAARSRLRPPMPEPKAACSSSMPRRCMAIPTTATRLALSSMS